ncbi:MAG: 6-pyruvoyl tetrahydropterin synthase family protein [Myxococcota bacterium]
MEGEAVPVLTMTRRMAFSAAHRYHNPAWDPARNEAAFGDCTRVHGHNYVLEASVTGPIDPRTGMLMSIAELKAILAEEVAERYDHRRLDEDVAELRACIPTSENVARAIWARVRPRVAGAGGGRYRLSRLRLFETGDLFVEIDEASAPREG